MRHHQTQTIDNGENTLQNNAALTYNSLYDRKRPLPPEKHTQLVFEFMRPDGHRLKNVEGLLSYPTSLEETLSIVPHRIRPRLLKIALADNYASEKIINRPALATALMLAGRFNNGEITNGLHCTDKEILEQLEFPLTFRAIFKKLVPLGLTKRKLQLLKILARDQPHVLKRMYHIERINDGVLAILFDPLLERIAGIELLNEVGCDHKEDCRPITAQRLGQAVAIQQKFNKGLSGQAIKSTKAINCMLKEFRHKTSSLELPTTATFLPPLPGTNEITPLKTVMEIKEMGVALDNCLASKKLGSYVDRIAIKQDLFIYKVELTKRFQGVFSVKRINGNWIIDEFEHDGFPEVGFLGLEMYDLASRWIMDFASGEKE